VNRSQKAESRRQRQKVKPEGKAGKQPVREADELKVAQRFIGGNRRYN
jgi:hypothetical protein